MKDKKWCSYCGNFRPIAELSALLRGRGNRRITTLICTTCKASRERHRTTAERDAYGQTVKAANGRNQAIINRNRKQQ